MFLGNCIAVCYSASYTAVSSILIPFSEDMGVDMGLAGLLFTANCLGFIGCILLVDLLLSRHNPRKVFLAALAGFAAGQMLFAASGSFPTAFLAMVSIGGFQGLIQTHLTRLMIEIGGVRKTYYINRNMVFYGVGSLAGPLLSGLLLYFGQGWRLFYWAAGIGTLVMFLLLAGEPMDFAGTEKNSNEYANEKRLPLPLLLAALCLFLECGAEVSEWGWMAACFTEELRFSAAASSLAVSIFGLGQILGRVLCGRVGGRFALQDMISMLSAASFLSVLVSCLARTHPAVYLTALLMGMSFSGIWPLLVSLGSDYAGRAGGREVSFLIICGSIGSATVPFLLGRVGAYTGLTFARALASLLFLAILLLMRLKVFAKAKPK